MRKVHDLAGLAWTVEGSMPYVWQFERRHGSAFGATSKCIDVRPVPARVPGSVQGALREAGILPDWNIGLNSRDSEWVEHRHWMYRTRIPNAWLNQKARFRLECQGLDYSGWILVNEKEAGTFKGSHLAHVFDITRHLKGADNVLEIVFDLPPRWLGQFGRTSRMREWKARFNYTWDWVPRLVQIGVCDSIALVAVAGGELQAVRCVTDLDLASGSGCLSVSGAAVGGSADRIEVVLEQDGVVVRRGKFTATQFRKGVRWSGLDVRPWWPNGEGEQPLYTARVRLLDPQGNEQDRVERRVGFRHVEWKPCEGATAKADPWLCVVNGRPVFLQGVNFAPLCANYADLTRADYAKRLGLYRKLGCNVFRINACQFLERQCFYDLCDELGLMVWQEFPLTSSGLENWPPEDKKSIAEVAEIARSFIERRRHHASLVLWSGGNELMGDMEGRKTGMGKPCGMKHPMLKRLGKIARELDPDRRYIPTSPSGPRAWVNLPDVGKGLHWDVHGPNAGMGSRQEAKAYWAACDALFLSEVYCSGASSAKLIRKYAGGLPTFPPTGDNPYFSRLTPWWVDLARLVKRHGREPRNLTEYVRWSQKYQSEMLGLAMKASKSRFPACGGVLLWSGHDTFPMPINTSLIDFDGNLKPVASAVAAVWRAGTTPRKQRKGTPPS